MPPKTGGPRKKGAAKKAKKRSAKVAVTAAAATAEPAPEPAPAPAPELPDPWAALRSPYGGRLSAADEFARLGELGEERAVAREALGALEEAPGAAALALRSCDLQRVVLPRAAAEAAVSLDLSDNRLREWAPEPGRLWLRRLVLTGNLLEAVPANLGPEALPKLLSLTLSYNALGSLAGVEALAGSLRALELEGCGLADVRPALALAELRELGLAHNAVAEAEQLEGAAALPRLAALDVRGNPGAGDGEWLAALARRLPRLKRLNGADHAVAFNEAQDMVAQALARSVQEGGMLGEDSASCSCVEGNPCAVPTNCRDWRRRFEVARAAREEKYDLVF